MSLRFSPHYPHSGAMSKTPKDWTGADIAKAVVELGLKKAQTAKTPAARAKHQQQAEKLAAATGVHLTR